MLSHIVTIYSHKRGMRQRDASVAAERALDAVHSEKSQRPQLRKSHSDRRFRMDILWLSIAPMHNHKTVLCRKRGLWLKVRKSARWRTRLLLNDQETRLPWRMALGRWRPAVGHQGGWPVVTKDCAPTWAPWGVTPGSILPLPNPLSYLTPSPLMPPLSSHMGGMSHMLLLPMVGAERWE